ncbi:hypothetical protein [Fulvivirga lutimaris]|uniref:hypothetical protein n=1 Tax=Fulvivirga lutimaris TaxID=1819566 RepID=UPI0012BB7091|nr:hypothetical protein [Fulvivirga lutimaris]MTI40088.1 hypothetical protein [Fulvivirga lutimaris]
MILIIINIIVIALYLTWLYKKNEQLKKHFFIAAGFKLLSGIGVGALYQYYYTFGDTYAFFNIAEELNKVAAEDFRAYLEYLVGVNGQVFSSMYDYQPRALFMVKLLSVINLLTGGNYWISSLYFSLFAFSGAWYATTIFLKFFGQYKGAIIFSFFYFPSAVFWCSGIIKESVAVGCIYFIASYILVFVKEHKLSWLQVLILLLNFFVLWNIKYYYAAVILLLSFSLVATSSLTTRFDQLKRSGLVQAAAFFLFIVVSSLIVTQLHPNFYLHRILGVIVDNYQAFEKISAPGDFVEFSSLEPNVWSVLANAPKALVSGIFRPFIGESAELFKIVTGLENLVLLGLLIVAVIYAPKERASYLNLLFLSALLFVVIMAVFLTLSAPNYGTLIRYKTGFLPFFVFIVTIRNPWVNKLFS